MNMQAAISERYSRGAEEVEPALCCPVTYDKTLLELIPQEILEKDYGCGDPSPYVRLGDTVLDLGSGAGKLCYIMAQLVGDHGQVIGVDINDDMLALARKYQPEIAERLGADRVRFLKGYIQDLSLDVGAMDRYLVQNPVQTATELEALKAWQANQRLQEPLIGDGSVDLVVSNCVLNLVSETDRRTLVNEIFRVLKRNGRLAICDIVSDEVVPEHLKRDPKLWSGCISGAFQEQEFLRVFTDSGFVAVRVDQWSDEPWQVVEGIEFRAATVVAVKGAVTPSVDRGHVVIYRGPYASVSDDAGHSYPRGERMAVSEDTFKQLTEGPYREDFIGITPTELRDPAPCCVPAGARRPASQTKGAAHLGSTVSSGCCG
jgi:ubiquinone/menaquinone biosynthesis C-methylase UbiE